MYKTKCATCNETVVLTNKVVAESKKHEASCGLEKEKLKGRMIIVCNHCKNPFVVNKI